MAKDGPTTGMEVQDWVEELDIALKYRRDYGLEDSWPDIEEKFYERHPDFEEGGPNLIYSVGDAFLSSMTVPNPYIFVKPLRPDVVDKVRTLETLDNILLKQLRIRQAIVTAVTQAYLYGRGFLKIGYDSEWGFSTEPDTLSSDVGLTLSQFSDKGERIEFNRIKPGMPWVLPVLPHDMVVPWGTGEDLNSAPWVAQRIIRHIDDVRSDTKYENTKRLEPTMTMEDFTKSYTAKVKPWKVGQDLQHGVRDTGTEYVELWEIHDRRTQEVLVMADGHDKFLRKEKDLLQIDGFPYVSFAFVPSTRTFWVTPDAYYQISPQEELTDISRMARRQRRSSVLKFLMDEDLIEDFEAEKLLSEDVGVLVKAKPQGRSLRDAVVPFAHPNYNQGLYMDGEVIRRNAREMVGFSRNQVGEFEQTGRRTATEASIVEKGASLRMDRRQGEMRNIYEELIRKVNHVVFEFWKTDRTMEILGEDGEAMWATFSGKGLKGDYLYDIQFSVEEQASLQQRQAQSLQLYSVLAQDPHVDPIALRSFLRRQWNDPNFSALFPEQGAQNADTLLQMQQMQGGGGGAPAANGGGQGPAQMPRLPGGGGGAPA